MTIKNSFLFKCFFLHFQLFIILGMAIITEPSPVTQSPKPQKEQKMKMKKQKVRAGIQKKSKLKAQRKKALGRPNKFKSPLLG